MLNGGARLRLELYHERGSWKNILFSPLLVLTSLGTSTAETTPPPPPPCHRTGLPSLSNPTILMLCAKGFTEHLGQRMDSGFSVSLHFKVFSNSFMDRAWSWSLALRYRINVAFVQKIFDSDVGVKPSVFVSALRSAASTDFVNFNREFDSRSCCGRVCTGRYFANRMCKPPPPLPPSLAKYFFLSHQTRLTFTGSRGTL
jgi:hypothetical protein